MAQHPEIFLDFNSTTPVDKVVLDKILPFFSEKFANPASITHFPEGPLLKLLKMPAMKLLKCWIAITSELIFTSGSTESINLAIKGVAAAYRKNGKHIISWTTEHPAVLDVLAHLGNHGYEITLLPVTRDGHADLEVYRKAIRRDTILTCMMMANNETGVIHPVKQFVSLAHEFDSLFFCDATQAAGKIRVDINELGVDLLCLSAHKMYGPKGTGALYVRRKNPRVYIEPLIDGGGHENGLRSGTLNVPGIVGFGEAVKISTERYWDDGSRLSHLRTLLEQQLTDNGMGYVNGDIRNRIPILPTFVFQAYRLRAS
jgi:cysteine desulfurase